MGKEKFNNSSMQPKEKSSITWAKNWDLKLGMLSRGNNLLQFLNSSLNEISATSCLVKYTKWLRTLSRQEIGQLNKLLQKYVMSYFMSHSLLNSKNKENQGKSSSNLLNLRF